MGNTLKCLAERDLPERTPAYGQMVVDLCENVHIHRRELRQEFTLPEFFEHLANLNRYAEKVKAYLADNPEYEEQAHHDTVLICGPSIIRESPKPNESAYFPHRLRIELEHPHSMGEVHVHFRDYRLHLTLDELRTMIDAFAEAGRTLEAYLSEHTYRPKKKRTMAEVEKRSKEAPMPGPGHFKGLIGG